MAKNLTMPQRRVLEYLKGQGAVEGSLRTVAPRALAKHLWPDSPAWERRTRAYGSNRNGAMGGTMPMKAATILHRLADRGLTRRVGASYDDLANLWVATYKGLSALEGPYEP